MNALRVFLITTLITTQALAYDVTFVTTELPQALDTLDFSCHQRNSFFGFRCPVVDARLFDPQAPKKDVIKSMLKKFGPGAQPYEPVTFLSRLEDTLQIQLDYVTRYEGRGREGRVAALKSVLGDYLAFLAAEAEKADLVYVDAYGSWGTNLNAGTYYLIYFSEGKLFKIDHGQ